MQDDSQVAAGAAITATAKFASLGQGVVFGSSVSSGTNELEMVEPELEEVVLVTSQDLSKLQAGDRFAVAGTIDHTSNSTSNAFGIELFDESLNRTNPLLRVVRVVVGGVEVFSEDAGFYRSNYSTDIGSGSLFMLDELAISDDTPFEITYAVEQHVQPNQPIKTSIGMRFSSHPNGVSQVQQADVRTLHPGGLDGTWRDYPGSGEQSRVYPGPGFDDLQQVAN